MPPVAFITWPTNQPARAGFALACSALPGLAAMTLSTSVSIAPRSVTWVSETPLAGLSLAALALGIGNSTVKNYITSIFGKLDVRDRAQAVIAAYESGLVTARTGDGGRTG